MKQKNLSLGFSGEGGEQLHLLERKAGDLDEVLRLDQDFLGFIWFCQGGDHIEVEGISIRSSANQLLFFTAMHRICIKELVHIQLITFNREFYCVLDHDSEVGCKGLLYYGAADLPLVTIPPESYAQFRAVMEMFWLELKAVDKLQLEMLQIMLKRLLILSTRYYKTQEGWNNFIEAQVEVVREFNFLVEKHFMEFRRVGDYAALMHKSPKTLSNSFQKLSGKTPLQFIQERIMIEARKRLLAIEKPISSIAFELGFEDAASFSRFFKKYESVSPRAFREKKTTNREKVP
jgi:AraC-like DNA-binding protein